MLYQFVKTAVIAPPLVGYVVWSHILKLSANSSNTLNHSMSAGHSQHLSTAMTVI